MPTKKKKIKEGGEMEENKLRKEETKIKNVYNSKESFFFSNNAESGKNAKIIWSDVLSCS